MSSNTQIIHAEIVSDLPTQHATPAAEISAINRYHQRATAAADEARSKAEEASHFALLAGTLLEDLHASTPHGEWGKLFQDGPRLLGSNSNQSTKWLEFGQETARKYIEVAKRIRQERALTIKAQKQLKLIAAEPEIDDAGREFLNRITQGQTLRQLYLGLDIITSKDRPARPATTSTNPKKSNEQALLEDAREAFFLWRESFEKLVRIGMLEEIDQKGLLEIKEFCLAVRDRVNARLK